MLRFQLADPALPTIPSAVAVGDDVTVASIYLAPQRIAADRTCDTTQGLGAVAPLG